MIAQKRLLRAGVQNEPQRQESAFQSGLHRLQVLFENAKQLIDAAAKDAFGARTRKAGGIEKVTIVGLAEVAVHNHRFTIFPAGLAMVGEEGQNHLFSVFAFNDFQMADVVILPLQAGQFDSGRLQVTGFFLLGLNQRDNLVSRLLQSVQQRLFQLAVIILVHKNHFPAGIRNLDAGSFPTEDGIAEVQFFQYVPVATANLQNSVQIVFLPVQQRHLGTAGKVLQDLTVHPFVT